MTLQERLRALTGPCREVDAEIAVMFRDCPNARGNPDDWIHRNYPPVEWRPYGKGQVAVGNGRNAVNFTSAKFTASLDAAVELVEREMPGRYWVISAQGKYVAEIGDRSDDAAAVHTLPAVALLLALIEAKDELHAVSA